MQTFGFANLVYDTIKGLDCFNHNREKAPLKIFGTEKKENFVIYITCATAGYDGKGPRTTYDILTRMGFNVNLNDIIKTNYGVVSLHYDM